MDLVEFMQVIKKEKEGDKNNIEGVVDVELERTCLLQKKEDHFQGPGYAFEGSA